MNMLKEIAQLSMELTTSHIVRFVSKDKDGYYCIGSNSIFQAEKLCNPYHLWNYYRYEYCGRRSLKINNLNNGSTVFDVYIHSYHPEIIINDMLSYRKETKSNQDLKSYIRYIQKNGTWRDIVSWDLDKLWDIAKKTNLL